MDSVTNPQMCSIYNIILYSIIIYIYIYINYIILYHVADDEVSLFFVLMLHVMILLIMVVFNDVEVLLHGSFCRNKMLLCMWVHSYMNVQHEFLVFLMI